MEESTVFGSAVQAFKVSHSFFVSGSSDVISEAGRRRSTSSRGVEKDVKSTSRGEAKKGPSFREIIPLLASDQHRLAKRSIV